MTREQRATDGTRMEHGSTHYGGVVEMAWRDSGSRPSGGRGSCRAVGRSVVRLGRSLALPESCKAIQSDSAARSFFNPIHSGVAANQAAVAANIRYFTWSNSTLPVRYKTPGTTSNARDAQEIN